MATSLRIAVAADLHCRVEVHPELAPLLEGMSRAADVLCFCGDLTDHGRPEEARLLARGLEALAPKPLLGVLGNHDYESDRCDDVRQILSGAGMRILAGDECVVDGVGFAGAKGFAGGFGQLALEPWGERAIKDFVHEAVSESLLLENALARLRTSRKVVLLHYAPIAGTVAGEPAEILPFLGSTRLEEPINRYRATAVFHGHAHHGSPAGSTSTGIPVYNVAMPLLQASAGIANAFRILEVPSGDDPADREDGSSRL